MSPFSTVLGVNYEIEWYFEMWIAGTPVLHVEPRCIVFAVKEGPGFVSQLVVGVKDVWIKVEGVCSTPRPYWTMLCNQCLYDMEAEFGR